MSNPSGPPRSGGLTPPAPSRPGAPGSANGPDDTAVRPAVRVDDDPPTLAQRIMQSRGSSTNGGSNGSNGSRANGSGGSAPRPAAPPSQANGQPSAKQQGAGAPNTGQPFRNGSPRPAAGPAAATYSPVPGSSAPAAPAARPTSQPTAPVATPGPAAKPKKKLDPFSAWRGSGDAATAAKAPPAGAAASPAPPAPAAPAARQSSTRETIITGSTAAGAVPTGQAARGVPEPAAKKSAASAPSSATSASSKSDKLIVRRTRKARLRLSRVDPWSVMKTAFMFSIAAGIVLVVAVYALWSVIQASDMFTAINQIVQDALGTQGDTTPFQLETYINTPKVMGATALIAVVDVVLITALATLTAFLYNLSASVLGGLEVTLAED